MKNEFTAKDRKDVALPFFHHSIIPAEIPREEISPFQFLPS
ncbi:MAG: hypothetical protein AB7T27_08115 [Kiritimatiellia bacterium]